VGVGGGGEPVHTGEGYGTSLRSFASSLGQGERETWRFLGRGGPTIGKQAFLSEGHGDRLGLLGAKEEGAVY